MVASASAGGSAPALILTGSKTLAAFARVLAPSWLALQGSWVQ